MDGNLLVSRPQGSQRCWRSHQRSRGRRFYRWRRWALFELAAHISRLLNITPVAGYSWKTNQYGLTIDTVTAFELVLPNGHVKVVTEEDTDLWFALRVRLISVS